jgi:hypothetical protein
MLLNLAVKRGEGAFATTDKVDIYMRLHKIK